MITQKRKKDSLVDGGKYLGFVKIDGSFCSAWFTFRFVQCRNIYKIIYALRNIRIHVTSEIFYPRQMGQG